MSAVSFSERSSDGDPDGLLILHHGRGADDRDLLPLADILDPERRLHVASPRGPLTLPGWDGFHWYAALRVGYPDPETFETGFRQLAGFHDQIWERTGVEPARTVFGGFSMGSVISFATGLGSDRPAVAGILAFSGFIPAVDGWQPDLATRPDLRAFIAHGRRDPLIPVGFARAARDLLEHGGLEVEYHETDVAHQIDPHQVPDAKSWLAETLA